MIPDELIEDVVVEMLRKAVTKLPADVEMALQRAYDDETDEVPKTQLETILTNIGMAEEGVTPMCQDTGVQIFFVKQGSVSVGDVEGAIGRGVARATSEVPLRPNTVHPISRKNHMDNNGVRMPYINMERTDGPYLEMTVMPKGAGSENMSAMAMLTPSQGLKGIKRFALDTLVKAGGKPCPPIIIGMGIGGSADISIHIAKEALLRPLGQRHEDPEIAALEEELFEALNGIGIGPMGLGGRNTLLGLNVEYAHCHTASLPVAINIQCWAARRCTARIYDDGRVEYPSHEGGD
ncbi:MAG: fumarate hydratase [Thermoplasmata archaeon]|nr:MAG: fumarate hydratase [Thermoplasmata archaeon]